MKGEMMIKTKRELMQMIRERDMVSAAEAKYMVEKTQQIIDDCFDNCTINDIEDILMDNLGIEMDYIYLFIM